MEIKTEDKTDMPDPHPKYGPCDAIHPSGACSECLRLYGQTYAPEITPEQREKIHDLMSKASPWLRRMIHSIRILPVRCWNFRPYETYTRNPFSYYPEKSIQIFGILEIRRTYK